MKHPSHSVRRCGLHTASDSYCFEREFLFNFDNNSLKSGMSIVLHLFSKKMAISTKLERTEKSSSPDPLSWRARKRLVRFYGMSGKHFVRPPVLLKTRSGGKRKIDRGMNDALLG